MVTKVSDFLNTTFSTLTADDAVTNGVSYPGTIVHSTTGTPATGIGAGLRFQVETAANNIETGMTFETVTTDITNTSEDFDFVVKLMQNGATAAERFRVTSAGAVTVTGTMTAGSFFTTGTITGSTLTTTGATVPTNGMYLPAANTVGFATNSIERMRFDAAGRAGLNVTSLNANLEIGGGTLATAANSQSMVVELTATSTSAELLQISSNRNATGGADWTTAGYRIQQKVDATWMGFIQFNGGGSTTLNNGGISFGTGQTTTSPNTITEKMRVDINGNVAIGTTATATARLSIVGTSGANTIGEIYASDGTQWSRFASNLSGSAYNGIVGAGDHGIIYSNGTSGTGAFTIAPWNAIQGGVRLDANGNVSIGVSSVTAGYKLDVSGGIKIAGGGAILLQDSGDIYAYRSGGTTGVIFLVSNGSRYLYYDGTAYQLPVAALAVGGAITAGGEITAFSSDARLKTNVTPLTNALEKVQSLSGVNFTWTDQAKELGISFKNRDDVGVMAQDVERVLPEAVRPAPFDTNTDGTSKSGENYLTVQYEKLTVLLIEAVKEQQQQIDSLTKRIDQLENKPNS